MPAWLIETFASELLTQTFWFVTLMTAPPWLAMIFLPRQKAVRGFCRPLIAPVLYVFVWGYLCYEAWKLGLPELTGTGFQENRNLATHPMIFLAGWCQLQILHLLLGCWLYQDALKRKWSIPGELLASWILGPLGLLIYALRVLTLGKK